MSLKQKSIEQTLVHIGWLKVFFGTKSYNTYRYISSCPNELKKEMDIQRIGFEQKGLDSEVLRISTTTLKKYLMDDSFYENTEEIEIVLFSNASLAFSTIFSIGHSTDNGNQLENFHAIF